MNDIDTSIANGSFRNQQHLKSGVQCGCFYCMATFAADGIREWTDDGMTALCPACGIDSVLPGVTDQATLRGIHDSRFGQTILPSAWDSMPKDN